jgi:hypothetical protein
VTKVYMLNRLGVSADTVWRMIGGFNALPDWHPAIEKSELDEGGRVRTLSLAGGGAITERLDEHDDAERTYTYSITQSPLPVANYTATIKVTDEDGGCAVEWSSLFDPHGATEGEASQVIEGIYKAGFDNLRKLLGVPTT